MGQKHPNGLGLYDMSGNVWEWFQDWCNGNYYENSPRDNPTGPSSGKLRCARGGSWSDDARFSRTAYRGGGFPAYANPFTGFRLARTP